MGPFWRFLDWLAIQYAASRMPDDYGTNPRLEEATRLVKGSAFLSADVAAADVLFSTEGEFTFPSPLPSPFEENNIVFGRLYPRGSDWREGPVVVLVHGWNDAPNHYFRFPALARKFNAAGMSALTFELPYHFRRRPRRRLGAESNFLSANVLRTAQAAGQTVAELRALTRWLSAQGCPKIGLFGVSLGGWLGGLAACHEPRLDAAALLVPVSRLDRTIEEVAFCRSIRAALKGQTLDLGRLNLLAAQPLMGKENVLLIAADYDQFVPPDTVEELARAWGGPELWRLRMGHVSALGAPGLTRRVTQWLCRRLDAPGATHTRFGQDNNATAPPPPSSNLPVSS